MNVITTLCSHTLTRAFFANLHNPLLVTKILVVMLIFAVALCFLEGRLGLSTGLHAFVLLRPVR